jgi:hypothetical protein
MTNEIRELSPDQLDQVSGGNENPGPYWNSARQQEVWHFLSQLGNLETRLLPPSWQHPIFK